jgi:hypothetical protein
LDGQELAEFVWKSKHVRIAVAGHRVYVACAIENALNSLPELHQAVRLFVVTPQQDLFPQKSKFVIYIRQQGRCYPPVMYLQKFCLQKYYICVAIYNTDWHMKEPSFRENQETYNTFSGDISVINILLTKAIL